MLDPDETAALNCAEGEDFDMDLNMQKARMMPQHSCQTTTEEVEPLMLKLTMIRSDFVNKELNAGNSTISIKKIVMQDKSVNTELNITYQKAIITENDKKKNPAKMKECSILSGYVKYVMSDGSETFHKLNIDQMNYRRERGMYKELEEKELLSAVNVGGSREKLRTEYLDV